MIQRKMIDCRQSPSEKNCTLRIEGTESEVLEVVTWHAIHGHGHHDSPELRKQLRSALQDADPHSNVDIVRLCYDAFMRQDIPTIIGHLSNDVDWESAVGVGNRIPTGGRLRGPREVEGFFARLKENVNIESFEPREFIGEGNRVVVLGRSKGVVNRTGRRTDSDWVMTFQLRDGKITEFREYTDTATLLAAYGIAIDQPAAVEAHRRGTGLSH